MITCAKLALNVEVFFVIIGKLVYYDAHNPSHDGICSKENAVMTVYCKMVQRGMVKANLESLACEACEGCRGWESVVCYLWSWYILASHGYST